MVGLPWEHWMMPHRCAAQGPLSPWPPLAMQVAVTCQAVNSFRDPRNVKGPFCIQSTCSPLNYGPSQGLTIAPCPACACYALRLNGDFMG